MLEAFVYDTSARNLQKAWVAWRRASKLVLVLRAIKFELSPTYRSNYAAALPNSLSTSLFFSLCFFVLLLVCYELVRTLASLRLDSHCRPSNYNYPMVSNISLRYEKRSNLRPISSRQRSLKRTFYCWTWRVVTTLLQLPVIANRNLDLLRYYLNDLFFMQHVLATYSTNVYLIKYSFHGTTTNDKPTTNNKQKEQLITKTGHDRLGRVYYSR